MNSSFASITVESGISQQYIPFVPTLLWYKLAGNSSSIRKGPLPYYRSIYTSATSGQVSHTEQDIIFVFTNESTIPWETTYHGLPIKKIGTEFCVPTDLPDTFYHPRWLLPWCYQATGEHSDKLWKWLSNHYNEHHIAKHKTVMVIIVLQSSLAAPQIMYIGRKDGIRN